MKYRINRTSDWDGVNKPCRDAYVDEILPEVLPNGRTLWAIDICSIEQMDELVKEVRAAIIISKHDGVNEIEIYDTYR